MIIPIRCWSCGKPIGHLWEDFLAKTNNRKQNVKETLDDMGLDRYCCRAQFLGQSDLLETVAAFKKF